MMSRNRVLRIFVFCLSILAFIDEAEARKVRVAIPSLSLPMLPFFIANEKGYYRDEGLEVELIVMGGGRLSNLALLVGEVDFTTVPTAAITAALQGAPLRIVFTAYYRPLFSLLSKPDLKDVKQLKGKKVSSSGGTSATDVILRAILARNGLQMGRDVTIIAASGASTRLGALMSGVVDAAVLPLPSNLSAEEAGFRTLVSFVKEDWVVLVGSIVVHQDLLKSDPLLVAKFIRGTLKGFFYARENRSGSIPIIVRSIKSNLDVASKSYDQAWPAMTHDGTLNQELQKKALALFATVQEVKEPPRVERVFEFSLVPKIAGELAAAGWKP